MVLNNWVDNLRFWCYCIISSILDSTFFSCIQQFSVYIFRLPLVLSFKFISCSGFPFTQFLYIGRLYLLNLRVTWLDLLFEFEFEFDLVRLITSYTIWTDELLGLVPEEAVRSDPQYVWLLLESSYAFLSKGIVSSRDGLVLCDILRGLEVTDSDLYCYFIIYENFMHLFDIIENQSLLLEFIKNEYYLDQEKPC